MQLKGLLLIFLVIGIADTLHPQVISFENNTQFQNLHQSQFQYLDTINNTDSLYTELNIEKRITNFLNLSNFYIVRDYNRSLACIQTAEKIAKEHSIGHLKYRIDLAYAEYFFAIGKFSEASEKAYLTLKKADSLGIKPYFRSAKNSIAKLERENDNYTKGLNICLDLIKPLENKGPSLELADYYLNAANISMNLKGDQFSNAKNLLDKAYENFFGAKSRTGMAMVSVKYGRFYKLLYFKDKNREYFDKAFDHVQQALKIFNTYNQTSNKAYANYTLATLNSIDGNHEASISYYKAALRAYNSLGNLSYSMRINQHLFVAYSILGQQENAVITNNIYIKLKDSIFNIEKRQLISDSEVKFQTEKVKNEKEIAQLESSKNLNLFIGATLISSLILLSSLFYFGRIRAQKKAELTAVELKATQKQLALEKQYRTAELKALKSQMNPHFIFNSLNSIQEYVVLNKKKEASSYLQKFASLIRSYLDFSEIGTVTIKEEYDTLTKYLELEKLRFEDTFTYTMAIEVDVPKLARIPTMLIQPFVENALVHGLLHKKNNRKLEIVFALVDKDKIKCTIKDNGVGREYTKELKRKVHGSFATKATKDRLELLNYRRDKKIGIEINDLYNEKGVANGTRVILTIPLLKTIS